MDRSYAQALVKNLRELLDSKKGHFDPKTHKLDLSTLSNDMSEIGFFKNLEEEFRNKMKDFEYSSLSTYIAFAITVNEELNMGYGGIDYRSIYYGVIDSEKRNRNHAYAKGIDLYYNQLIFRMLLHVYGQNTNQTIQSEVLADDAGNA